MGPVRGHCLASPHGHPYPASPRCPIQTAGRHADLFWASCGGGGGTFGVATRLSFRLRRLPGAAGALTSVRVQYVPGADAMAQAYLRCEGPGRRVGCAGSAAVPTQGRQNCRLPSWVPEQPCCGWGPGRCRFQAWLSTRDCRLGGTARWASQRFELEVGRSWLEVPVLATRRAPGRGGAGTRRPPRSPPTCMRPACPCCEQMVYAGGPRAARQVLESAGLLPAGLVATATFTPVDGLAGWYRQRYSWTGTGSLPVAAGAAGQELLIGPRAPEWFYGRGRVLEQALSEAAVKAWAPAACSRCLHVSWKGDAGSVCLPAYPTLAAPACCRPWPPKPPARRPLAAAAASTSSSGGRWAAPWQRWRLGPRHSRTAPPSLPWPSPSLLRQAMGPTPRWRSSRPPWRR